MEHNIFMGFVIRIFSIPNTVQSLDNDYIYCGKKLPMVLYLDLRGVLQPHIFIDQIPKVMRQRSFNTKELPTISPGSISSSIFATSTYNKE